MNITFAGGLVRLLVAWGFFVAMRTTADTLVYGEQNNNPSWFSPDNWFTYDAQNHLQPVGHPPAAGDTAIVGGTVDALGNAIHLATLIVQPNATIINGGFVVGTMQMNGGNSGRTTTFSGSVIEVLTEMDVMGGSCTLMSGSLTIDFGAVCYIGFNGAGQLTFTDSQVFNAGQISLQYPGSYLNGGTNLMNLSGGVISSSTNTSLTGDFGSTFDNSGTVRSDAGTLTISGFRNWPSSSGISKYKTTIPAAFISFTSGLVIPGGVTNIFSGPGTNLLSSQITVTGTAQVGVIPAGTQNVDAGNLEFTGTLSGTGNVHVVALPGTASTLLVNPASGGTITGLVMNIDLGGVWLINYNQNSQGITLMGGVVNNSGTVVWSGAGGITMINGAVINNLSGALFDTSATGSGDAIIGGAPPGGGAINNSGTLRKSSGSTTLVIGVDFNNAGLLDVENGQVQLAGGNSSGSFNTAGAGEIWFSSNGRTNQLAPGAQFSGLSVVRAKAGALYLAGDVSMANFSLEGGTLDGPGQMTVEVLLQWSSGTMQGNGAVALARGATAKLTGGNFTQRTFNNSGIVTMTNGFVGADDGAVFNNLVGGSLQLLKDGGFGFPNSGLPRPVLNNFGSIVGASPTTMPLAFLITNSGSVLLESNQLNCHQYIQLAGTTTIASNITLNSGSAATILLGGIINGNGIITGSYGVTNAGAELSPGITTGVLTINNNAYYQTAQGVLNIEIAGTNAGQYDSLAVPAATLNGILNVSFLNGFQPSVGDVYTVVSTAYFGSISGRFSQLTGPAPRGNIVLVPVYGNFGVSLVAVQQPSLAAPARHGTNSVLSFQSANGVSNVVQYTDSLSPANWLPLTNFVGDGSVRNVTNGSLSPERFYRVQLR